MRGKPSPETTLAIILGAHEWPDGCFAGSKSFFYSAAAIGNYLLDPNYFDLPAAQLLDLFDKEGSPSKIINQMADFLEEQKRVGKERGRPFRDLFLYYVGHGSFQGANQDYMLALKSGRKHREYATNLHIRDLAECLKREARWLRRFLVLDCCFAAAANRAFQSNALQAAVRKSAAALPERGTVLLCSSSHQNPSIAPLGERYTMFSGAFYQTLQQGVPHIGSHLSMQEVCELTWDAILDRHAHEAIRPELHAPAQPDGNLASLPFFPNLASGNIQERPTLPKTEPAVEPLAVTEKPSPKPAELINISKEPRPARKAIEVETTGRPRKNHWEPIGWAFLGLVFLFLAWKGTASLFQRIDIQSLENRFEQELAKGEWAHAQKVLNRLNDLGVDTTANQKILEKERTPKQENSTQERGIEKPEPASKNPEPGQSMDITLPGGKALTMKWIPAGSFTMGSPKDERENDPFADDETLHEVVLTQGFWLSETEVTQAQWQAVMGHNPSYFKGPNLPVEYVSWEDVEQFIKKLNDQEPGRPYSLPTEAQWEYACRAGTKVPYAGVLDEMAWYNNNSDGRTHEVRQKKPNVWGLYDMHGNVWEWCRDWYGPYPEKRTVDPEGPDAGSYRVVRGGSWFAPAGFCRSAYRPGHLPEIRSADLGFRLLRTPL